MPAGPLREKKERLESCDLIVVNGKNNDKSQLRYQSHEMTLTGQTLINLSTNEEKPLSDFYDQEVQALTGIGNPQRFYSTLKASGLKLNENSFPDHYAFEESDLTFDDDSIVIMTEKDAVKCKSLIANAKHYWYLPVVANLSNDFDEALLDKFKVIYTPYIT